jgi:hypothetical protein
MSLSLKDSPITGGYCPRLIEPKYEIKTNTYANLVSAIKQSYEDSKIQVGNLDLSRMNNNLMDLTKESKSTEIIYLTSIVNEIFGKNPKETWGNFIRYKP